MPYFSAIFPAILALFVAASYATRHCNSYHSGQLTGNGIPVSTVLTTSPNTCMAEFDIEQYMPPPCVSIRGVYVTACDNPFPPNFFVDFQITSIHSNTECVRNIGVTITYHCVLS